MRTGGFFFFKIQGGGGGSLVTGDVGFMSMMRDGLLDGRLDVIRTLMDGIEVLLYISFLLSFSPLFFFFCGSPPPIACISVPSYPVTNTVNAIVYTRIRSSLTTLNTATDVQRCCSAAIPNVCLCALPFRYRRGSS